MNITSQLQSICKVQFLLHAHIATLIILNMHCTASIHSFVYDALQLFLAQIY